MTDPHLWLHGDPADGRTLRRRAGDAGTREAPAGEPPPSPTAAPRTRGSRWRPALVGGAAAATLTAAGLFGLGAFDADGTAATPTPGPAAVGARQAGDVGAIYAAASPAVVSIRNGGGTGTGFVVDRDGTIVTNAHVVGNASEVQVRFDDDRTVDARVLGSDPSSDLAALRVDPGAAGRLQPLSLADSDQVRVGQLAVAIGSPFGLEQTATAGIVSGTEREIRAPDGFTIDSVIQTDAPINPGNSGGPLLDANGRVIGVNSQIQTGGGNGNVGIGFAVPSNTVREVLPRLERGERIERPWLGVGTVAGTSGAEVEQVTAGSPAQRAGLRAGDVIASVDGRAVREPDDIAQAIADRAPGDRIELTVRASGGERTVQVELGTRPAQP